MTSKRKLRARIAALEADLFAARQAAFSEGLRASPFVPFDFEPVGTGAYTVRCTCPPNRGDNYAGTCPIHDASSTYTWPLITNDGWHA